MIATKACPVVLHHTRGALAVLAFKHPLAGHQLAKGTIEPGETSEDAALRELAEESGISDAVAVRSLGTWSSGFEGQVWQFIQCKPRGLLPASWFHQVTDDGGHAFEFFWHPLSESESPTLWHAVYRAALMFIRSAVERHPLE